MKTCRVCGALTEPAIVEVDPQAIDLIIDADAGWASLVLCSKNPQHGLGQTYWNSIKNNIKRDKSST